MVNIKEVTAKSILDSRNDKTISVTIKTNVGNFSASSPTGKSRGKHESKTYRRDLKTDIETIKKFSDYFSSEVIEKFEDLRRIEDIVDGHLGANTIFALESAILKAVAAEQKKEVWEIINPELLGKLRFPRLVGNCIGGGKHSQTSGKKPDFQEFLLIPKSRSPEEAFEILKNAKNESASYLKRDDEKFNEKKNDENAWLTSLNDKQVLDVLEPLKIPLGLDIASSSFFKRKKYIYDNPPLKRTAEEQISYISNMIKNYNIFYVEDPFDEEDFENFAKLLKKFPDVMIVGDDLTTTNSKRLKEAIEKKSINSIIVKPNQIGFLSEVKTVCTLARKNNIKIVFSHRSGETEESILADLAFGFQAEFIKTGITGKEREAKIKRLIQIENSLRKSA